MFMATYLLVLAVTGLLCALFGAGKAGFRITATIITALSLLWAVSAIRGGFL
jgi:hypothetical protein